MLDTKKLMPSVSHISGVIREKSKLKFIYTYLKKHTIRSIINDKIIPHISKIVSILNPQIHPNILQLSTPTAKPANNLAPRPESIRVQPMLQDSLIRKHLSVQYL